MLGLFFMLGTPDPARSSDLRFAVISDIHVDAFLNPANPLELKLAQQKRQTIPRDVRARLRRLLQEIKKKNPEFVVVTGDLVNLLDEASIAAFDDEIQRSGLKVYRVPGNHDGALLENQVKETPPEDKSPMDCDPWDRCEKMWRKLGKLPLSASFEMKGKCFVFLDNSDGRFRESELAKASAFLDKYPDCRFFLFFHKPIKMSNETRIAKKTMGAYYGPPFVPGKIDIAPPSPFFPFLKKFENRVEGIFAGHIHAFSEARWHRKFYQRTLQAAFVQGMYALVDCEKDGVCHCAIYKAFK